MVIEPSSFLVKQTRKDLLRSWHDARRQIFFQIESNSKKVEFPGRVDFLDPITAVVKKRLHKLFFKSRSNRCQPKNTFSPSTYGQNSNDFPFSLWSCRLLHLRWSSSISGPRDGENLCRLEIFRYPGLFFGFIVQNWFLPVHRNEFSPGRLHFPHLFPLPPTQLLSLFPIFNVNFSSWFIDLIDHVWPWKLSALFQRLDVRNFQFGPLANGEQGLFPVVVVAQVVERHHSSSEGRLRIPDQAFRSELLWNLFLLGVGLSLITCNRTVYNPPSFLFPIKFVSR